MLRLTLSSTQVSGGSMASNEKLPPLSPEIKQIRSNVWCTPPGKAPCTLGLAKWQTATFAEAPLRAISPNSKPVLQQQRDHSACRRPDTLLEVKKTRENLKDANLYTDLPPPCLHMVPAVLPPPPPLPELHEMQRHKSISRRMLSRVKQGITNGTRSSQSIRATESDTSLIRRLSSRRNRSTDVDRQAQSFKISRESIDSTADDNADHAEHTPDPTSRSFTSSTVSTSEVADQPPLLSQPPSTPFDDYLHSTPVLHSVPPPPLSFAPSSPSPDLTPRPFASIRSSSPHPGDLLQEVAVPHISLDVSTECQSLDVGAERDIWIAVEATVHLKPATNPLGSCPELVKSTNQHRVLGSVTSLRLCFKPAADCQLVDVVGQKAMKDLCVGQQCLVFVKVHIPKIQPNDDNLDPDQDSLLIELESILGTLEMDLLHVEARHKHSLLPHNSVVTIRRLAKIRRPKIDSRWSILSAYDSEDVSMSIPMKLAGYIGAHYPRERAIKLIDRYLGDGAIHDYSVQQIRQPLIDKCTSESRDVGTISALAKPSVVVTDIDVERSDGAAERSSTAPYVAHLDTHLCVCNHPPPTLPTPAPQAKGRSTSLMALSLPNQLGAPQTISHATQDDARKLWRHIRRTSLTAKQFADISPDHLLQLEADDEKLKELRQRAIANKRSIGAETLRSWKWEEKQQQTDSDGEAPWL